MKRVHISSPLAAVLLAALLACNTSAQSIDSGQGGTSTRPETVTAEEDASSASGAGEAAATTQGAATTAAGNATGGKVALIVAIADYASSSGWDDLSSDRDLELLKPALETQGFRVLQLTDSAATRAGIVSAFRDQLVANVSQGDLALFHYSGHGHQITDNNGDEIDGYDEVLVPHDAPAKPGDGYDGRKHLRDDELNGLLRELRRKLGEEGEVVVSIDACFSGTGTRGEARVRGSSVPIGPPAEQRADESEVGGGYVEAAGTRGSGAVGDEGLAPMIALSASKHDELADEASDDEGFTLGSLTYGMLETFPKIGEGDTYRSFFAKVRSAMAQSLVGNTPQAEGQLDAPLFQGKPVVQDPFFRIGQVSDDGTQAMLEGGSVGGLSKGTQVEVYATGTVDWKEQEPLAAGVVEAVTPLTARVKLDFELFEDEALGAWAYVTAQSFGDLGIVARLDGDAAPLRDDLQSAIERDPVKFLELEGDADVVLRDDGGNLVIDAVADGRRLWPPPHWEGARSIDRAPISSVMQHLKDFARNRFLRRMELQSTNYAVAVEVNTCTLACDSFDNCTCEPPGPARLEAGNRLISDGAGYTLAIRNRGKNEAFVQILELMPDGQWGLLWPIEDETPVPVPPCAAPCQPFVPTDSAGDPILWGVGPPFGENVFKVFASKDPIDFRWLLGPKTRGTPPNPLEQLFDGVLGPQTRGSGRKASVPRDGGVTTSEVVFQIVPE